MKDQLQKLDLDLDWKREIEHVMKIIIDINKNFLLIFIMLV